MVHPYPERRRRDQRLEGAQAETASAQDGRELCGMAVRVCKDGAEGGETGAQQIGRIGNRR